jgi:hypothetical protein
MVRKLCCRQQCWQSCASIVSLPIHFIHYSIWTWRFIGASVVLYEGLSCPTNHGETTSSINCPNKYESVHIFSFCVSQELNFKYLFLLVLRECACFIFFSSSPRFAPQAMPRTFFNRGVFLGVTGIASNLFHRIALMYISVSFSHTIKATQPLFSGKIGIVMVILLFFISKLCRTNSTPLEYVYAHSLHNINT